jgi:SAM-dependent methyltransferase
MSESRSNNLRDEFGPIDIYLFDQILRGRITANMRILDAGCGRGRNLIYLLRSGADVFGVDTDPDNIEGVRKLARSLSPAIPADQFRTEPLDHLSFLDASFDVVLCNAVLHFMKDEAEFRAVIDQLFRVLRSGGLFFARLASTIGIEKLVLREQGRWHGLPDGSSRFLVDAAFLEAEARRVGADLADPLKTTVVQNQRSMTTWVLRKD